MEFRPVYWLCILALYRDDIDVMLKSTGQSGRLLKTQHERR